MKARTVGIVAAAGLAALVGCKEEPKCMPSQGAQTQPSAPQEPKYTEEITSDCIHVYKEQVPYVNENEYLPNYQWVQLDWCRGETASIQAFWGTQLDQNRTAMTADTILGNTIWYYYRDIDGSHYLIKDNPASVASMNIFGKRTWNHICSQLDCNGLLEKQEKLRNEQMPQQPEERVWTEVLENVYFLNDKPGSELPDAIFTAGGDIVNLDSLWVKNPNEVYADYGRDGIVDEVASSITGVCYYRNAETAELFNRADAALAQAKKEIGLQ